MIIIAIKITWQEPEELTITKIEINRATSIYGTYAIIAFIDATSDGAPKSASNTWITNYTDVSGSKTNWYKLRFYDGTADLYSEYSDPIAAEELLRLCTVEDVRRMIETTGRWTDDEIFDMITEVDDLIYIEAGTPIQGITTYIGRINGETQYRYYVGEENIYRIDRVFYGTDTKSELFLDDEYKTNLRRGMIQILPYASSGIELDTTSILEIHYVPMLYHKLSLYRTCQSLLEQIDTTSGKKMSKELEVITKKVQMVEKLLMDRIGVQISSDLQYYDTLYGVNLKHINQDFDRNKYVGTGFG